MGACSCGLFNEDTKEEIQRKTLEKPAWDFSKKFKID